MLILLAIVCGQTGTMVKCSVNVNLCIHRSTVQCKVVEECSICFLSELIMCHVACFGVATMLATVAIYTGCE